jgi:peroxiredoxin
MSVIAELFDDLKFIITFRTKKMKSQRELNAQAPKAGDLAPDFTLSDISGEETVTLSDFRGKKPVALIFGSFT